MIHHHYEESVKDDIDNDYESNITEVDHNIVNEAVNFFSVVFNVPDNMLI